MATLLEYDYLASGHMDGHINIWDTNKLSLVSSFKAHASSVEALSVFKGNGQLASSSHDGTIKIWMPYNGTLNRTIQIRELKYTINHSQFVFCFLTVLDDESLASVHNLDGGMILIWNVANGTLIQTIKLEKYKIISLIALNDDMLAGATDNYTINIWKSKDWGWLLSKLRRNSGLVRILEGHTDQVNCLVSLPGRKWFASGSRDTTIKIWENRDNGLVRTLKKHTSSVTCLSVLLDGSLTSASSDGTIRIWNPWNGDLMKTIRVSNQIASLSVLNDGRLVYNIGTIKVLEIERNWDLHSKTKSLGKSFNPKICLIFFNNKIKFLK